ncbi:Serine/threonine-protein phosphatase 4 regulatory subunit 3 [Cichlidogyrus casuarinus]|uniref:Serine/threonine-protein phosphatase 4 regulatory subunit 3 n=1 Tax=Cichlidogyrus casuarinus TaxID=1844966 RepID=A0ABD2QA01_9PLAT
MDNSDATTRRRVKLYILNEKKEWDDKGTGHVSAIVKEENLVLMVISENDGSTLLESNVLKDTPYHRQQHTLIVWSEGDNVDLALSFQERNGCNDIWEKICVVQGKDPSVDVTQEIVDESDDGEDSESYNQSALQTGNYIELPNCELSRLEDICNVFNSVASHQPRKERLIAFLEHNNYLSKLVEVFHKAEDLEATDSLHQLFEIMRHIIMLNKPSLYEIIFSEQMLMDVVGMLEFNPSGRQHHREFLSNQSNFKEVLKITNQDLIAKIHQTYRVQYIQECCLPPPCLFMDEHSLSALKSFIQMNKTEIITSIQEDADFLENLFAFLKDPTKTDEDRRDFALLAREFCNISMQSEQKENSLNCMFQHGVLQAVEILLRSKDREIKTSALDILNAFIDNQASLVREYIFKTSGNAPDDNLLINVMIQEIINDTDPEMGDASILSIMLRNLIDPDNMSNGSSQIFSRSEKTEFLSFFYKHSIQYLTKPLFENTTKEFPLKDDYHTALVMHHIIDLLTFCFENHNFTMRNYCLNNDVIKKVLVLLRSSHSFLALNALRLMRKVVGQNDEFYFRYIVKYSLFKPVLDLFIRNGHRYNLVDSAVIELFQHIRSEEIFILISHIVDNYWESTLRKIDYVPVFAELKQIYDRIRRSRFDSPASTQMNIMSLVGPSVGGAAALGSNRLPVLATGGSLASSPSNMRGVSVGSGGSSGPAAAGLLASPGHPGIRSHLNVNSRRLQSYVDDEEKWFNNQSDEENEEEDANSFLDTEVNANETPLPCANQVNSTPITMQLLSRFCGESEEKMSKGQESDQSCSSQNEPFRPRLNKVASKVHESDEPDFYSRLNKTSKVLNQTKPHEDNFSPEPMSRMQSKKITFARNIAERIDPFSTVLRDNEEALEEEIQKFFPAGSKRPSSASEEREEKNGEISNDKHSTASASPPGSLVDYSDEEDNSDQDELEKNNDDEKDEAQPETITNSTKSTENGPIDDNRE